ncbi:TIR domain-containing protein [Micromonospora sp. CPCC 206060]|uniref:TIR domain-containing protein n=1 Tax=Micromonospora sp. CPCC 206060 TaxID=3122406 RepID=UPI002FF39593
MSGEASIPAVPRSVPLRRLLEVSAQAVADNDLIASRGGSSDVRLSRGAYVPRTVETTLLERLTSPSVTALIGEAGHGKTVLLWRLHQRLTAIGRFPLVVPASALVDEAGTPATVTVDAIDEALTDCQAAGLPVVLLVDTLDLLLQHRQTRGRVNALLSAAATRRVPTLVTSRPVEARQLDIDYAGEGDRPGTGGSLTGIRLGPYDRDEQSAAIAAYARVFYAADRAPNVIRSVHDASLRGLPLREVCRIPLAMRLLFELYAPDEDPPTDVDTIGLYERFWWRRIEEDHRGPADPQRGPDLTREAEAVGLALLTAGLVESDTTWLVERARQLARLSGAQAGAAIGKLHERGVLVLPADSQRLRFFHQTFFEHAAARGVAAAGPRVLAGLAAQVAADPLDLFYGEVAAQTLLLAGRDHRVSSGQSEEILAGWLTGDANLVTLAMRTYARMTDPGPTLREPARTALRTGHLDAVRDYLRLLPSVRHTDFERVADELAICWERARGPGGTLAFEVLAAVARFCASHPERARRFLLDHDCLEWLLRQRPDEWRRRFDIHLQLFEPLSAHEPGWCARELARFFDGFAATRNIDGMADILALLRRITVDVPLPAEVLTVVEEQVRCVHSTHSTERLEREYAVLRAERLAVLSGVELLVHICAVLGPPARRDAGGRRDAWGDQRDARGGNRADRQSGQPAAGSTWSRAGRRAELRACAGAAATLGPQEAEALLDVLLREPDVSRQDGVCTLLGEALADPDPVVTPLTGYARRRCRTELTRLPAGRDRGGGRPVPMLFGFALHNTDVADDHLLAALPTDVPADHWYDRDALLPLLVPAALAGRADAADALRSILSGTGRQVPQEVRGSLVLARLQYAARAGSRAAFEYLVEAGASVAVGHLFAVLRGMDMVTAQLLTEYHGELRSLRSRLVESDDHEDRRQGYILWRLLLERGVERAPGPDELAPLLGGQAGPGLTINVLELVLAALRSPDWVAVDPNPLLEPLRAVVAEGVPARRQLADPGGPRDRSAEQLRTREMLARQALVATHARLVPLPTTPVRLRSFTRAVFALVRDAGYRLTVTAERTAFTACFTELGYLVKRVGGPMALDLITEAARLLHAIAPEATRWRENLSYSWSGAITAAVRVASAAECQRFVTVLLDHDVDLAGMAVRACADTMRPIPDWLRDLEPRMAPEVREHFQAALRRQAREGSTRAAPDLFASALGHEPVDGSAPAPATGGAGRTARSPDPRDVFVIHGRDEQARKVWWGFLQALDLHPVDREESIRRTGSASPYRGEVIAGAFPHVQATVVLLTPDDVVRLHPHLGDSDDPEYEARPTGQARPDVLFEAGMAFALHPDRTVVIGIGHLRPFPDIEGRDVIRFDGSARTLKRIAERLRTAGCAVRDDGDDWLDTGRFAGLGARTRRP